MNEQDAVELLRSHHGIITSGETGTHFVLSGGLHTDIYIDARVINYSSDLLDQFGQALAEFRTKSDVVVGVPNSANALAGAVARHLSRLRRTKVVHGFIEKGRDGTLKQDGSYTDLVWGYSVVVVENTISTGKSVAPVIKFLRSNNAYPNPVFAIWNRGAVATSELGHVITLECLIEKTLPAWDAEECLVTGPCSHGIPIDTGYGHGAKYASPFVLPKAMTA